MDKLIDFLALELPKYWKTLIALLPLVLFMGTEIVQAISESTIDGQLTTSDVYHIVVAAVVAFGVYKKRNRPADA